MEVLITDILDDKYNDVRVLANKIIEYSDILYKSFTIIANSDISNIRSESKNNKLLEKTYDELMGLVKNESNKLYIYQLYIVILHKRWYEVLCGSLDVIFKVLYHNDIFDLGITDGKNKKYIVYLLDKMDRIDGYDRINDNILFHSMCIVFGMDSLINKSMYAGLDLEFTNMKIMILQVIFEHSHPLVMDYPIFMSSPSTYSKKLEIDIKRFLFCSPFIRKLGHGIDAKDLNWYYPFLSSMENNLDNSGRFVITSNINKRDIIDFTNSIIDTRQMCEYYKGSNKCNDTLCSIYSTDDTRSAVLWYKVITEKTQKELARIDSKIVEPDWYITTLTNAQKDYAFYDVLFLKQFFYDMIILNLTDTRCNNTKRMELEEYVNIYKFLMPEIVSFMLLESRDVTRVVLYSEGQTTPINNKIIPLNDLRRVGFNLSGIENKELKSNSRMPNMNNVGYGMNRGEEIHLTKLFELVISNMVLLEPTINIDDILKVKFVAKKFPAILKRIFYGIVSKKLKLYASKRDTREYVLDNGEIFQMIEDLGYDRLLILLKKVEKEMMNRLK